MWIPRANFPNFVEPRPCYQIRSCFSLLVSTYSLNFNHTHDMPATETFLLRVHRHSPATRRTLTKLINFRVAWNSFRLKMRPLIRFGFDKFSFSDDLCSRCLICDVWNCDVFCLQRVFSDVSSDREMFHEMFGDVISVSNWFVCVIYSLFFFVFVLNFISAKASSDLSESNRRNSMRHFNHGQPRVTAIHRDPLIWRTEGRNYPQDFRLISFSMKNEKKSLESARWSNTTEKCDVDIESNRIHLQPRSLAFVSNVDWCADFDYICFAVSLSFVEKIRKIWKK